MGAEKRSDAEPQAGERHVIPGSFGIHVLLGSRIRRLAWTRPLVRLAWMN
jgi:hypothetical protein